MSDDCKDISKPELNEDALECCDITGTNCVGASKYFTFLGTKASATLTSVIDRIIVKIKANKTAIEEINEVTLKEYEARLSQSSTDDPDVVIGKNTLATAPAVTRTGPGQYEIVLANAFPSAKTFIYIGSWNKDEESIIKAYRVDDDTVKIETGADNTGYDDDDILSETPLKINVYV